MNLINIDYEDYNTLKEIITTYKIPDSNSVLIQIFHSHKDIEKLYKINEELNALLPQSSILATSTAGVITEGICVDDIIQISFSIFEASTTKALAYKSKTAHEIISDLEENVISSDTKLLIIFANVYMFDATPLIHQLGERFPYISLSGGNAGDDFEFKKCELFTNHEKDCDVIIAVINSKVLNVKTKYFLNWQTIGQEMIVSKSDGVKVYEINNRPIIDVYRYYLGDHVADDLLTLGIEFPLIFKSYGTEVARALVAFDKDEGSISFAGNIPTGVSVRFSYANIEHIENETKNLLLSDFTSKNEGIYIYSCASRRQVLDVFLNEELSNLNNIAPSTGFITYGEFFHDSRSCQNNLLNLTTTYVVLNESQSSETFKLIPSKVTKDKRDYALKAITTLVSRTNHDLEEKIKLLEETKNQLIESEKMAALGALVSGVAHEINTPLGIGVTGISQIQKEINDLEKKFKNETLSKSHLEYHVEIVKKLSDIIFSNLNRASKLIESFKNISVDQHSDEIRLFNLHDYLDEILFSIQSTLKKKHVEVLNKIAPDVMLESYPGSFFQIFTNLIANSILHAFEDDENNCIEINSEKDKPLCIHFKDNGKGIKKDEAKKIFDPFYTTARGNGGSGLGLSIIYNLISQKLGGTIDIIFDDSKGLHFSIDLSHIPFQTQ